MTPSHPLSRLDDLRAEVASLRTEVQAARAEFEAWWVL